MKISKNGETQKMSGRRPERQPASQPYLTVTFAERPDAIRAENIIRDILNHCDDVEICF